MTKNASIFYSVRKSVMRNVVVVVVEKFCVMKKLGVEKEKRE